MKDRLVALFGGLAALLAMLALLIPTPSPTPDSSAVSRPTSEDRGPQGWAGLNRWLEAADRAPRALEQRYTALAPSTAEAGSALLFASIPQRQPARVAEIRALVEWVSQGHGLVLAVDPGALESYTLTDGGGEGLLAALDLRFRWRAENEAADALADRSGDGGRWRALPGRPTTAGVETLVLPGASPDDPRPSPGGYWGLSAPERLVWPLFVNANGHPQGWWLRVGSGRVVVLAHPNPFANAVLDTGDNARWIANLIAELDARHLWFDDFHQGRTAVYDPERFFRDPRVHGTIGFLLALWGVYLLGAGGRLGPPRPVRDLPRADGPVIALGYLFERRLRPEELGSRLVEHVLRAARGRMRAPDEATLWRHLAATPGVDRSTLERVRAAYERLRSGRRSNLQALTTDLERLRIDS